MVGKPKDDQDALSKLLETTFKHDLFADDEQGSPPIPYVWRQGSARLVVIVGDNATGKSLLRKLVCHNAQLAGYEPINVSMAARVRQGFERLFMYGSESDESTGYNSARTVTVGIETCRGRDRSHIIFWDEPDLGLSDRWSAGMGAAIRQFWETMPDLTVGAFVVTHNKALIRQLAACAPHYVSLGALSPPSLWAWLLDEPAVPAIGDLEIQSRELRKRVATVIRRGRQA